MTHRPNEHGVADWGLGWFRVDTRAGCAVVSAGGEIDLHSAVGLHRAVQAAFGFSACLIINMSRVSFVDSTGLGVLIGARNRARDSGGSVLLVAPPANVRRLLAGTRLQQSFPVFDTLDEAVGASARPDIA
jgi:anti-sigma B factor antagonist